MANKQCFMPFFYDWIKPLSALSGAECQKLLIAMAKYHQNGEEIPEFEGMAGIAADFIFPQLDRAKESIQQRSEAGLRSAQVRRERKSTDGQRTSTINTNTNTNTTTNTTTNTNTNTTTITTTNTNTITNADAVEDGMAVSVCDQQEGDSEHDSDTPIEADSCEDRFHVFWEHYPKKQNKKVAKAVWDRFHPDDALLNRMLSALEWQKKSPAWTSEEGRYIPAPSSWLNQCRWEDEKAVLPIQQTSNRGSFDTAEFYEAALRHSMAIFEQAEIKQEITL